MDPTSRDQLFVRNPHLKELEDDVLFHIGITAGDHKNLKNLFGDVKVIEKKNANHEHVRMLIRLVVICIVSGKYNWDFHTRSFEMFFTFILCGVFRSSLFFKYMLAYFPGE